MPNVLVLGGVFWGSGLVMAVAAGVTALRRDDTVARWFAMTLSLLALAAFGSAASLGVETLSLSALGIFPLVVLVVPVVWARFVFAYYGLFDFTSRRRTVAMLAPAVLAAGAGTWVHLARAGVVEASTGVVEGVYFLYATMHFYSVGVVIVGIGLLLQTTLSRPRLEWTMGVTLAAVVVGPWFGNLLHGMIQTDSMPVSPAVGTHLRAVGFLLGAVAVTVLVARNRLFDGLPAAATAGPDTVLQDMDDVVVVTDRTGAIVRCNQSGRRLFAGEDAVIGASVATVLGRTTATLADRDQVRLPTTDGPGYFDPSVTELTTERGDVIGETIVLRDVTEPHIRRQRLTVLNRVLRHNLRNETSSIVTRAQLIADEADGRHAELASSVAETAFDIADIGDKARRIERMMAVPEVSAPEADAAAVLRDVVEDTQAAAECAISLSAPETVTVRADQRILYPVVEDAVENAIEHNDRESPTVEIAVTVGDGPRPVEIAIADDGPGIPDAEQYPLVVGEEAPLEHSSGLGLWGVKWGVTRMGGRLAFEANEPRGTIVRISLPTPDSRRPDRGAHGRGRSVPEDFARLSAVDGETDPTRAAADGNGRGAGAADDRDRRSPSQGDGADADPSDHDDAATEDDD
jgi:signal transduction histidine kinase